MRIGYGRHHRAGRLHAVDRASDSGQLSVCGQGVQRYACRHSRRRPSSGRADLQHFRYREAPEQAPLCRGPVDNNGIVGDYTDTYYPADVTSEEITEFSSAGGGSEYLWVDGWDGSKTAWTEVGTAPYLDAESDGSYASETGDAQTTGDFTFEDHTIAGTFSSVSIEIYAYCTNNDDP